MLTLNGNRGLVRRSSLGRLRLTGAVLFDCDGVLIDSRGSYDRAIEMTVAYFLSRIFGLKMNSNFPIYQFIEKLRDTGQFNNDIDTTAVIMVSILASLPAHLIARWQESSARLVLDDESHSMTDESLEGCKEIVQGLQEAFDSQALASRVLDLLEMASNGFTPFVGAVKARFPDSASHVDALLERLRYPGSPSSSLLSRVFNEYYYGPSLIGQLYGLAPVIGRRTGLIDAEKVIVSAETLRSLWSLISKDKIGIVSGRSRLGTEYTLGKLIRFFQEGPMVFLEDKEANLSARQPFRGKPSPEPLLDAADLVGNAAILYVGDSVEDLLMTRKANLTHPNFAFCGVIGTARTTSRASMFAERGADAILESVNDLPALLSTIR